MNVLVDRFKKSLARESAQAEIRSALEYKAKNGGSFGDALRAINGLCPCNHCKGANE